MKFTNKFSDSTENPLPTPEKISILGSTGSIGQNTLEIVRQFPKKFQIHALSCIKSIHQLAEQIKEFHPRLVSVGNKQQALELKESFPDTKFFWGNEGLLQISSVPEVDTVVAGIVGAAGLQPTFLAVQKGKKIALANKEPLVMAGELFVKTSQMTGSKLLPADSEHNAIFQSIHDEPTERISRLFLTASGGPFRDRPLEDFEHITISETLNHPNWKMGPKITVDSATMMNKGLEIIEAHWLFKTPVEKIEVLMQRESIIHSMVEFIDGSFLAQMSLPDMRIPLAYCLGWPERLKINIPRMEPVSLKKLHFEELNLQRFPCLKLSYKAAKQGGGSPAVLNGANEEVVSAFLNEEIKFIDIHKILISVMGQLEKILQKSTSITRKEIPKFFLSIKTLEDAIKADKWGRDQVRKILEEIS